MEDAISSAGSHLLDTHQDADHHRSVFTFAGSPDQLLASLLDLAAVAFERIDLRTHQGVHPRIGALDVVPFVPLTGATTTECVEVAQETGRRLAETFDLPVFLYADAATVPERRNLADLRRGGLTGLADRMRRSCWHPDFGPSRLHPSAGAVAVGARPPLVAFNVVLDAEDLSVARSIAAEVRAANGGPPGVKALGLRLESRGQVQVSMNLCDIERTSILQVFEAVADAAVRRGVLVAESEIVGLAPRHALRGATECSLRFAGRLTDHTLENRLGLP